MIVLLVVAKAPVPGFAKTRLCPPATPEQAAGIAAAALLDTLDAVLATPDSEVVVAMTGTLADATAAPEIAAALRGTTVIPQRGNGFAARLANAHADTAALHAGLPVLQIGMDTPQVTPDLLTASAAELAGTDAVLGAAEDGGWWALGLRDPRHAAALAKVPMSTAETGSRTREALVARGITVGTLPVLSDVDTMADARRVADGRGGRFRGAVAAVAP